MRELCDSIVVGAGTARCLLADRRSADPRGEPMPIAEKACAMIREDRVARRRGAESVADAHRGAMLGD